MIDRIKHHPGLKCEGCIAKTCEENNLSATTADNIPDGSFVVIKVDKYYNFLNLGQTPPSIDCLIVLKCSDDSYIIYLIELKNIKKPSGFGVNNIYMKFKTTIEDFMTMRFKDIFLVPDYNIKNIHLYFVSNPYRLKDISHKREGTKMDKLLSYKPFQFRGIIRTIQIENKISSPTIKGC
ncbi:MAG TPA: hypothetical protein VK469_00380 [Candidatus Kapabacteria bacterium]|nr:hypothetical protein [Candidatus Kapabacteria bacterium]